MILDTLQHNSMCLLELGVALCVRGMYTVFTDVESLIGNNPGMHAITLVWFSRYCIVGLTQTCLL